MKGGLRSRAEELAALAAGIRERAERLPGAPVALDAIRRER